MIPVCSMKALVKGLSNFHKKGPLPDIFLFSTARGGSTLIAESLVTQGKIKLCDEPLNLRNPIVRSKLGIENWEGLLPCSEREFLLRAYFDKIMNNKLPMFNPRPFSRNYVPFSNRFIFKILHGGTDMVNWFRDELGGMILILFRHPIAVTLSRKVYPALPFFLENEHYRKWFTKQQIKLAKAIINEGSHFEKGIVSWCLQNCPILKNPDKRDWTMLTYEDFVLNPLESAFFLSEKLQLSNPERITQNVTRPSRVVYQSADDTKEFFKKRADERNPWFLIEKWKKKISKDHEKRAFDILEVFEVDLYKRNEVLPNSKYLVGKSLD